MAHSARVRLRGKFPGTVRVAITGQPDPILRWRVISRLFMVSSSQFANHESLNHLIA
jgi:hypothetical protein